VRTARQPRAGPCARREASEDQGRASRKTSRAGAPPFEANGDDRSCEPSGRRGGSATRAARRALRRVDDGDASRRAAGGWGPTREARSGESRELALRLSEFVCARRSRVGNARAAAVLDAEGFQNAPLRALEPTRQGTGSDAPRKPDERDEAALAERGVQGSTGCAAATIARCSLL